MSAPVVVGVDYYDVTDDAWSARYAAAASTPPVVHAEGCLFEEYAIPPEACACHWNYADLDV